MDGKISNFDGAYPFMFREFGKNKCTALHRSTCKSLQRIFEAF